MQQSQRAFIIKELNLNGRISRNFCLNLYHLKVRPSITKLATRISELKQDGWEIERKSETDTNGNNDEVYYLIKNPQKQIFKETIIKNQPVMVQV